ncbi:MAG: tetratricopeptide repeat protein [Deltaproteobacteria bacterium]|nr:tetratricopeptide repeat protein [Deltaproteobacteria bacterium]
MPHIPRRISHTAFILMTLLLSTTAFQRTGIYKDDFSLWMDAAGKSPFKARPHNNLGRAYEGAGKIGDAAREYLLSVRIMPGYAPGRSNLAGVYMKQGLLDDAERELRQAIALSPMPFEDLHRRLGFVYMRKGLMDDAMREFEKAIALIPDHPDARHKIAIIYTEEGFSYTDKGDFSRALILHRLAVSLDAHYADAHYGLGLDYEAIGEKEHAIRHWEEYLRLTPPDEPFRKDAARHLERLMQ